MARIALECIWLNFLWYLVINAISHHHQALGFLRPVSRQISGGAVYAVPLESSADKLQVVVVGGGVGGLATAARIASSFPCDVTIIEKNSQIGGRSGSFDVTIPEFGTFRHERGPSLVLLPHIYHELFHDCSAIPEELGLTLRQCVPAYQVVFDDGDRLDVGFPEHYAINGNLEDSLMRSRRKMNSLEQNGAVKWDEYMKTMSAFLDCGLPNFIEERLDVSSFPTFIREALRDFGKAWPLKPHSDVVDAIFESEKMRALASFQDLYVGLEPYRNNGKVLGGVMGTTAPAVFGLLAAIELHPENRKAGVFAAEGGFRAVSASLEKLAKMRGARIETNKIVTKVQTDGVYICNSPGNDHSPKEVAFVPADLVVVNADLPYASKCLLSCSDDGDTMPQPRYDWDDSFLYSSGVVAFHWSIDKELVDLNVHNVFLAAAAGRSQSEESWRALRKNGVYHDNGTIEPFNFYVHRPTKCDPTAAPRGCDSLMVLVPCPTLKRMKEYSYLPRQEALRKYKEQFRDELILNMRQAVLSRLAAIKSLVNLKDHILDEVVDTPGTYADAYNVAAGTPFALSHGFGQLSFMRPGPNYGAKSPNILYCGASSRPGNGVPLVLIGSKLVAKRAVAQLKKVVKTNIHSSFPKK